MKRARISHLGRDVWAVLDEDHKEPVLRLPGGETVTVAKALWMPPVAPGATIFALGLNYAEHSAELGFVSSKAPPLIFLKGHGTFVGHRGRTPYPMGTTQMHPECELVAVIGQPARHVARADALDHVAGYTIANDYAIRDYLENYYRPNARVKNRDATTPIGPWLVDASDIGDPQRLQLRTTVNDSVVQEGTTADMILDVAGLVSYLSDLMTLLPGDMILTGTPAGVHFVKPGDNVICEIEGIGRLVNTLEAAA